MVGGKLNSCDPIVLPGNRGIGYRDETPLDRDERGVLLKRTRDAQGHGKPRFGAVHPARQRRAMANLLCQVCGNPADTNDEGTLWLLQDHREDWPNRPVATSAPGGGGRGGAAPAAAPARAAAPAGS